MSFKALNKSFVICFILVILASACLLIPKVYHSIHYALISNTPLKPLTEEEKIEDFEFLYETITQNYPYLEVNKRVHNMDWVANKEQYLNRIKATQTDMAFRMALIQIISELNNAHTRLITNADSLEFYRKVYASSKSLGAWQQLNFDTINHPTVLKRYNMKPYKKTPQARNTSQAEAMSTQAVVNAIVEDIIPNQVASITVPSMIQPYEMQIDQDLIYKYLQKVKDYQTIIIDIRGNRGGHSKYWADFLLPLIIDQLYTTTHYSFFKDGDMLQKYYKTRGGKPSPITELDTATLPNLPEEVLKDFAYYDSGEVQVLPNKGSIHFKGNIYLLVDRIVYSSAEKLASFAKETGVATLIGEQTGGDGIGSDPLLAMLPNSGYIFTFTKELGTTQDGTCNEEHKTIPDYLVEDPIRATNPLEDTCIQQVLTLEVIPYQ